MVGTKLTLSRRGIQFFFLFLYVFASSAFNLGTGFDRIFVRVSFFVFVIVVILLNRKLILSRHFLWCAIFWAFYFLSMIWASSASDTSRYLSECVQILGISLCLPVIIREKKDLDLTLNIIIIALLGTVIRLFILTPTDVWGSTRLGEAIGSNSNYLGMMLAFGSLISLYFLCQTIRFIGRKKAVKIIFYSFMIVLLVGVSLFTGSRKTIIIIIVGLAAFIILISKGWGILIRALITAAIMAAFLYFIFTSDVLYSILGIRMENMVLALTNQGSGGASIVERAFYIRQAMQLFFQHPVFGYGGNNFLTYMREINYSHIAYSHNNYTELLCTLGLIGFFIYYVFWVVIGCRIVRQFFKKWDDQILLFMIIIVLEFVLDYWSVSYINVFIQLLFLLAFIALRIVKSEKNLPAGKSETLSTDDL